MIQNLKGHDMTDVPRQMAKGEVKNYFWEAVLATLTFYFGMVVGGYFSSLYFLRDARRTREAGRPTKNVGCLWAVLIFHTLLVIGLIVLFLIYQQAA